MRLHEGALAQVDAAFLICLESFVVRTVLDTTCWLVFVI
jgi:hypothetical protein